LKVYIKGGKKSNVKFSKILKMLNENFSKNFNLNQKFLYRSMAMSTTLLFGRIGALAGSNVAGILLERSCDGMFIIAAIFLFTCAMVSFFVSTKSSRVEN
jgi:Zn-dependent protease with chaperone function